MEYKDINPLSYVTRSLSETYSGGHVESTSGTIADIIDANDATYRFYSTHHPGDGRTEAWMTFEATWSEAQRIERVYVKAKQGTYGGNYKECYMYYDTYLKISGVWTSVASYHPYTGQSYGSNSWGYNDYTLDSTTGWNTVTGMRVVLYGNAYSYEGDRQQFVHLWLYEARCYRQKYVEVLRLRKSGSTIRIGGFDVASTHKLRIRDTDSVTRGIPFVANTDPSVSPIKIYDGSTARYLPLADD